MPAPRRALVVVDVQQEYFHGLLQIQSANRDATLENVLRAVDVAERHQLPIVLVQHEAPEGAPVFSPGSDSWSLPSGLAERVRPSWKQVTKGKASVFSGTDVASWLEAREIDTITIVGYMSNNCDLATAAGAEERGLAAEILSDASGAIHLANEAGKVSADTLHEVMMVLLHSNFAAVGSTAEWAAAVEAGDPLPKSNLITSAQQGLAAFAG